MLWRQKLDFYVSYHWLLGVCRIDHDMHSSDSAEIVIYRSPLCTL